jgi:hypothetical protein
VRELYHLSDLQNIAGMIPCLIRLDGGLVPGQTQVPATMKMDLLVKLPLAYRDLAFQSLLLRALTPLVGILA